MECSVSPVELLVFMVVLGQLTKWIIVTLLLYKWNIVNVYIFLQCEAVVMYKQIIAGTSRSTSGNNNISIALIIIDVLK